MTTVSGISIDEVPGVIDAVVPAGTNVYAFACYSPKDVADPQCWKEIREDD